MDYFIFVDVFAALTVVGDVVIVFLVGLLLWEIAGKRGSTRMTEWISRHASLLIFIVALIATSGSLYFSEIMLWTPCRLCWYQRILMYPQVLLLGSALWHRDRGIVRHMIVLCIVGMLVSAYHYYEQIITMLQPEVYDVLKPCDPTGVSCRATEIFEYGYMTIPTMAFTAFALNALASIAVLRSKH